MVKIHLKKCVKSKISLADLNTLLLEIEFVINCRPLTFVSDCLETPKPIRPIDFVSAKKRSDRKFAKK